MNRGRGIDTSRPKPDVSQLFRIQLDDDHWAVELSSPAEVGAIAAEWDELTASAARPNVFLERLTFAAGWSAFGHPTSGGEPVGAVMIFRRQQAPQFPATPIGLFAVTEDLSLGRLAGPVLSMWAHDYSFDSTPLLRRGHTADAVRCFLDWVAIRRPRCLTVRFDGVAGDGPFMTALDERLSRRTAVAFNIERHNRAILRSRDSGAAYIEECVSSRTRRELRRQERRLREAGEVETRVTTRPDDVDAYVDRFLELESSGWKSDSSMSGVPAAARYFREVSKAAAEEGRFEGLELTFDGRPIAAKVNFLSTAAADGTVGGVAFKITYDETFAKFSPGVLLELETIRRLHDIGCPDWLDSCAKAAHPMIDRIWGDRTSRIDVAVSLGSVRGDLALGVLQTLRWAKRRIRPRRDEKIRTNF